MILDGGLQQRNPERERIQKDLDAYLDAGKMIEILGPGECSGKAINFHGDFRKEFHNGLE